MAELTTPAAQPTQGYRGPTATKIVGITYRQLDYWTRTGLITPSIQEATGSGTQRLYSFNDLLQMKVIKSLLDAGLSLQKVRDAIEYVQTNMADEWTKATIVSDGDQIYACMSEAELFDVMRRGQGVLGGIVAVDKVREQLDDTIAELRPSSEEVGYGSPTGTEGLAKEG